MQQVSDEKRHLGALETQVGGIEKGQQQPHLGLREAFSVWYFLRAWIIDDTLKTARRTSNSLAISIKTAKA